MKLFILVGAFVVAWMSHLSAHPETWEEQPVYATTNLASDAIVTVKALFAPGETPAVSLGHTGRQIHWDTETMRVTTQPLEIPPRVRTILSGVDGEGAATGEKQSFNEDDSCVYSVDIFPPYLYLYRLYQSFGRVFARPREGNPVAILHVSDPGLSSLRVHYCALEARKGLLPVFYDYERKTTSEGGKTVFRDALGLVSVTTGKIQTLGRWADESGNALSGPIAWIDDNSLALVSYAKGTTRWAVFDLGKKAFVAEGIFRLGTQGDFAREFIIRHGCFYGLLNDGSQVKRLYPAT